MRVVRVWSDTHYGRGTPRSNESNRSNIQLAFDALEKVVPGLPTYRYMDEDYGWIVPISDEQETEIRERYPDSPDEDGMLYLHEDSGKPFDPKKPRFADMLTIRDGEQQMVTISDLDKRWAEDLGQPVERTFDAFYIDWFENYGRH